jgi:hypothetical protein
MSLLVLFVSSGLISCCLTFNFRFEPSYVEPVMFNYRTFKMLKIALCGSSVIYVIVHSMCVCLILGIW